MGRKKRLGPARPPRTTERSNPAEKAFTEAAMAAGWEISKRGWPDFWLFDQEKGFRVVEVKKQGSHNLRYEQSKIMQVLSEYGIPCFRWDPENGFKRCGK